MATPTAIGIQLVSEATAQSAEVTSQAEVAILVDKEGNYSNAATFDPKFTFTVSGKGDVCPVAIGDDTAPTGVTGTVIINSVKNTTTNSDWESWEYSGEAFPSA